MKKLFKLLLISSLLTLTSVASSFAQSKELAFSYDNEKIVVDGIAKSCYLIFDEEPKSYTINGRLAEHPYFLHQYLELEACTEIVIEGAKPKEMHFFDGTDTPSWVQKWEEPIENADILLISSHADDEQLFFAGLLPYYTQVKKLAVQVAYATDHLNELSRHHERLNGLWAVGVRNYPLSSGFIDLYSETAEGALTALAPYGITEDDVISFEKDLLNHVKPKLVISHDLNGEYGHGMHKLVSKTLTGIIDSEASDYPFLKRVYLHLYDQNQIKMDVLEVKCDELGGLSPFEVTRDYGFSCHLSQHWTWFKGWIEGPHTKYSPLEYGCYYSADSTYGKTDLFEGLTSYEEDRIAFEKAEAERIEAERKKALEEEEARKALEAKKKKEHIALAGGAALLIALLIYLICKLSKKHNR